MQKVLSSACWRQLLHIQELLDFYIKEDLNEYNKERPWERGLKKKDLWIVNYFQNKSLNVKSWQKTKRNYDMSCHKAGRIIILLPFQISWYLKYCTLIKNC